MDGWPLVLSSIHVPFMEPRAAGVDVSDVVIMLFLDLSQSVALAKKRIGDSE